MKEESKARKRIATILFMFGVTFVFTSGVSVARLMTREKIAENESLFLKRGVLIAGGKAVALNAAEVAEIYKKTVEETRVFDSNEIYYRVKNPQTGETEGYVFIQKGAGLWGAITISIGVSPDMDSILGLYFLDQNETPGLGGRVAEPWFADQFKGKMGPFTMVAEGASSKKNEFDAITGATSTSNAVKTIINDALDNAKKILDKDKSRK